MEHQARVQTPPDPEYLPPRTPFAGSGAPPSGSSTTAYLKGPIGYGLFFVLLLAAAGAAYWAYQAHPPNAGSARKHPGIEESSTSSYGAGEGTQAGAAAPPGYRGQIRFGMVAPFTGPSKELGREMALGLNTAFSAANANGGVDGRQVKLITADDGYDPERTGAAVAKLREQDGVLGYVGNVGTPTAAVALPYALENHMLFFGAFTGAQSLRSVPPDRYVFNYRPSYAEETEAAVHYLVRVRGIQPGEIAVFAQNDAFGDSGFNGATKALRTVGFANARSTLRLGYERNSLNIKEALAALKASPKNIKAIVMVASYRPAAKFIEAVTPQHPGMLYTNVSFVGSTELANELKLLGPTYMDHVLVTQTVPSITGASTIALEYKTALAKFFPGEAPDYVSFEAFVDGKLLLAALNRAGGNPTTEALVSTLENMHGLELGLGSPVSFSASEHQASHKIWGTQLTRNGDYSSIDLD